MQKTEDKEEKPIGYPDISKANTKMIVIVSFICILIIFLLSVLIPDTSNTEDTSTSPDNSENTIEETKPGFTSYENDTYYYTENNTPVAGWLMIDDVSYLFREDGTMVTGWYVTEGKQYYFDDDGVMQKNLWIDNKYVGEDGYVLKDTTAGMLM